MPTPPQQFNRQTLSYQCHQHSTAKLYADIFCNFLSRSVQVVRTTQCCKIIQFSQSDRFPIDFGWDCQLPSDELPPPCKQKHTLPLRLIFLRILVQPRLIHVHLPLQIFKLGISEIKNRQPSWKWIIVFCCSFFWNIRPVHILRANQVCYRILLCRACLKWPCCTYSSKWVFKNLEIRGWRVGRLFQKGEFFFSVEVTQSQLRLE